MKKLIALLLLFGLSVSSGHSAVNPGFVDTNATVKAPPVNDGGGGQGGGGQGGR